MATAKTYTKPGYGATAAKNVNAPAPSEPVRRPSSSFSKIPGGK